MFPRVLWLGMILLIGWGAAADVPFVFDSSSAGVAGYSADQLESIRASSPDLAGVPPVTTPSDNEVLQFPVTGGGSSPGNTTEKNAGDLKKALDARVEPDNSRVHDEAVVLALKYPGEKTIEQIASIYNYLKNGDGSKKGWGYVSDPRGIDYFMFANQTLKNGDRANCVGGGDCDDFAILMSALIESIGGTTRIILARNSSIGGHAYTEVYLGNLNAQNNQVEEIVNWLKQEFNTDKIFTHIDTDSKDVWLNLDWGEDEKGNTHPGGPFYQGDKHIVLCIRDRYEKTALELSEPLQEETKQGATILPEVVNATVNQTVFEPFQDGDKQSTIVPSVMVSLEGHSDHIWSVAFSPDGRTLASGSEDNTIKLWDTASGTEIGTLGGYSGTVHSVAFSQDGHTLASGGGDYSFKLWDTASGRGILTLKGHSGWVQSVAFSPDGRILASGSDDSTIKLWDTANGTEIRTLQGHSGTVHSVAFSPDGRILASGSGDSTIKLWATASGMEIRTLQGHSGEVNCVAFSPDGRILASGSGDSTIKLWATASGTEIRTLQGHSGGVNCVAFSPDGRILASGGGEDTFKLWATASGTEIRTLQGHSGWVQSIAFSPDGHTLASGGGGKMIKLWKVA